MKKILLIILSLMLVSSAHAVEINSYNFPDETFREILQNDFDLDGDGYLSWDEISGATQLNAGGAGISTLEGIEYLTALEYLDCSNNNLALLDLSNNTKLTDLICSNNQLIWLNIANCQGLEFMSIVSNDINELNISGCPKLYSQDIDGSYSYFFDYDESTAIVFEYVPNPADDSAPYIRAVDLPCAEIGLPFSYTFTARGTQPITWNIYGKIPDGLTLSDDTISGIPAVSGDFWMFVTADNSFGYNMKPVTISVADTVTICPERFPDEKFRAYLAVLEREIFDGDGKFSQDELAQVKEIDITGGISVILDGVQYSGKIDSLAGIEYLCALEKLFCGDNSLTDINLSKNFTLKYLNCSGNRINFLDVSGCNSLVSLDCTANYINVLDLSNNTALKECRCDNTPLLSLNIDTCAELSDFSITGTGLPKLNISGCPELFTLEDDEYTYHFAFDDETQIVFGTVTDDPFTPRLPPVIVAEIPTALVSTPYSARLNASGAYPVIWTLESGTLPEGLSLDNSGTISGTPNAKGTSLFTVTASNSYGTDTGNITLQVMDGVSITTKSLKAGTDGKSYGVTLKASGTKPITWSAEGLPEGLKISSKGKISGKPSVFGEFSVKFIASNAADSDDVTLTLTVKGIAPKLSGTLAKAALNESYSSGLKLTKGSSPVTWSYTGNLPEGLSFDTQTGTISGTPVSYARSGFKLKITAMNGAGKKAKSAKLTVKGTKPAITVTSLPDATQGRAYRAGLTATGSQPITWSATNLPEGLTVSGDMITGKPTEAGTFRIRLRAENPVKYARKTLTLKVSTPNDTRLPVLSGIDTWTDESASYSYSYAETYTAQNFPNVFADGCIVVAELGAVSCDEAGLYEFGVTLSDDAREGAELVYVANSDNPSDDDDIAEFYDDTGKEISAVPENRRITIAIWLNPDTFYYPVIAIPLK